MADYVSYNMRSYFSKQPGVIYVCPACSGDLTREDIGQSKALELYFAQFGVGDVVFHHFSHLYTCTECEWWCVRESWGEVVSGYGRDLDYLIVGTALPSKIDEKISATQEVRQDKPWLRALADENVYDNERRLPEELGALFVGGQKSF